MNVFLILYYTLWAKSVSLSLRRQENNPSFRVPHCRVSSKEKVSLCEKKSLKRYRTQYRIFVHTQVQTGKKKKQNQRSGILKTKALKETFPIESQIYIKTKYLVLEKIKDQKTKIMFVQLDLWKDILKGELHKQIKLM